MAKRKCAGCGAELESTSTFCPKCGSKKKKMNMFLFFVIMLIIFLFVMEVLFTIFGGVLSITLFDYKYGTTAISEMLFVFFITIVLIIAGNGYIFKEKKIGFFRGLYIGLPMLLFSVINLISSITDAVEGLKLANLVNLMFFTYLVGLAEEFLCRGWVQNEFIERFGDNRKGVILSIFLSSLIFGFMHLTNALVTPQGLFHTMMQILQAIASGFLLGSVYYKTKNIWVVAFLHGFFDFALMLSEVNLIKDCVPNTTTPLIILGIVSSLLLVVFYLFSAFFALSRKSGEKVTNPKKSTRNTLIAVIGMVVSIIFIFIVSMFEGNDSSTCYKFPEKELDTPYSVVTNYRKEYVFGGYDNKYILMKETSNYNDVLTLSAGENKVTLDFDGNVEDYLVIDNENNYDILVRTETIVEQYICYVKIDKGTVLDKENLNKVKKKFKKYDVPEIDRIGYITIDNDSYNYPYVISKTKEEFFIDKDSELLLIKRKG
jgi:membrane protease YdiL (CAAX protease family)